MSFTCLALRIAALTVVTLHLLAGLLPEEAAWSVWPYTALPTPLGWLGGLAVAALVLTPANDALGRWLDRLWRAVSCQVPRRLLFRDKRLWFALIAAVTAIPFWWFRIRHLRWGDAYFIAQALSYTGPDRPIWTIYNWQSPLSILLHAELWLWIHPALGVSVETLYAITSVLSGVGFVYVLFLLADALGQSWTQKATIFGLVATTGSLQLFFGYVENYTIISLGLVLTLYLGVRCLRGEISLAWPSLSLAIANAFHPSTMVLWPAMAYVGWHIAGSQPSARGKVLQWARMMAPPALVFAGLATLMAAGGHGPQAMLTEDRPGGADGIPFVPLFQVTTEWQHYTLFSLPHLLDWANEHFLISSFGLFLLFLYLVTRLGQLKTARSLQADGRSQDNLQGAGIDAGTITFLAIASLSYLLLTFVWNPDYGGRRDWDLFAPSAFVYTPLAASLLARLVANRPETDRGRCTLARAARLLIAVSALHTLAWIYYNTIPWPPDW
jgi:hypothetical protein